MFRSLNTFTTLPVNAAEAHLPRENRLRDNHTWGPPEWGDSLPSTRLFPISTSSLSMFYEPQEFLNMKPYTRIKDSKSTSQRYIHISSYAIGSNRSITDHTLGLRLYTGSLHCQSSEDTVNQKSYPRQGHPSFKGVA